MVRRLSLGSSLRRAFSLVWRFSELRGELWAALAASAAVLVALVAALGREASAVPAGTPSAALRGVHGDERVTLLAVCDRETPLLSPLDLSFFEPSAR